jgi:hypothetical protein
MYGTAGLMPKPPEIQVRQVSLRFSERDFSRLDKAAQTRHMGKGTLAQQLVLEWLDSLDDGKQAADGR